MNNPLLDSLAKPPPPPSELDELMSRDPIALSAQDIDKHIAYQRAQRARREAGARPKKAKDENAPTIDLAAMMKASLAPNPAKAEPNAAPTPAPKASPAGFRRL